MIEKEICSNCGNSDVGAYYKFHYGNMDIKFIGSVNGSGSSGRYTETKYSQYFSFNGESKAFICNKCTKSRFEEQKMKNIKSFLLLIPLVLAIAGIFVLLHYKKDGLVILLGFFIFGYFFFYWLREAAERISFDKELGNRIAMHLKYKEFERRGYNCLRTPKDYERIISKRKKPFNQFQ